MKNPGGRPSLYEAMGPDEMCRKVIECGNQGMSQVEMAVELGVPRTTMISWGDQHEEFSTALSRATEASQAWWERQLRSGNIGNSEGQINPAGWKHTVSCRFRNDYRDSVDLNHGADNSLLTFFSAVAEKANARRIGTDEED